MGQDPRPGLRRRSARDEPARLLEGGRGRSPVARLPEIPALSLVEAGRSLRVGGAHRPRDGPAAEIDRRPVLPDQDGGLGGTDEDLDRIDLDGVAGRRDAIPQLDGAQVSPMRLEIGVARLGGAGGLRPSPAARAASSPAASQW